MEIKVDNAKPSAEILQEQLQALLETKVPSTAVQSIPKTPAQKAIRKTFKGTAHLAKLLPTGSVLAFQILSPVFTHQGHCHTITSQFLTAGLLVLCGVSCFVLCFSDSFRDERGKVRYGIATFSGMWVIDGSVKIPENETSRYRLRFLDFFHALLSILVFGAVAAFDKNVVECFWPFPTEEVKDLLVALPVGIGVICSLLFLHFPTQRHGIGTPLSRH